MLTVYVLKNGVDRYNIFFYFLHKTCWILFFVSFSCIIRQCLVIPRFDLSTFSSTNNFAHAQTLSPNEFTVRSYESWIIYWMCKKIKQRRISCVLGYLRMILWKISTAISIKYRILATFSINKKINSLNLKI
jgi:hypothetical protein